MRRGHYPRLSGWAQCNQNAVGKGSKKIKRRRSWDNWKQRLEQCTLKVEEGGGECSWSLEAGKNKGTDSPMKSPEGTQPCQHLYLFVCLFVCLFVGLLISQIFLKMFPNILRKQFCIFPKAPSMW